MWIHLRRTADAANGEETYEIAFNMFASVLTTHNRHFGMPDEKDSASLVLDMLCQNREFGAYYTNFQELMDILETTNDISRHHVLKQGRNHEMLSVLTIFPTPKSESFDVHIERLNELDCRLCALNTHSRHRPQEPPPLMHTPTTATAAATTATGISTRLIDLSAAPGKLSTTERCRRQAQRLCMYYRGVGHFAAEYPTRRNSLNICTAARTGRRALAGASAILTPDGSDLAS